MDESHPVSGPEGVGRRDFLRKSAVVGGLVWTAPLIQSIGSPAFALSPEGEENGGGGDISNVAFLLANGNGTNYKYEDPDCAAVGDGSAKPCVDKLQDEEDPWDAYFDQWSLSDAGTDDDDKVDVSCGEESWTINPADDYNVVFAAVKAGDKCYFFNGSALGKGDSMDLPNSKTELAAAADLII